MGTTRIEISIAARMRMKKTMSQNPNMLRTMIGIGLTLIFVLGYAVYSNTVESEYYGYNTSNEIEALTLNQDDSGTSEWYVSTNSPITWINVSVTGAPIDSILKVQADGVSWFHSPLLGENKDYPFNCEGDGDFSELVDTCAYSSSHELPVPDSGDVVIRGIVSSVLPIEGLGYLQADDINEAEDLASDLVYGESGVVTWRIGIYDSEGNTTSSQDVFITADVTVHDLVDVKEFEIDPIEESVYSLATLIGCFTMMLIVPLIIYFSAIYKAKKDESVRLDAPSLD